MCFMIFYNEKRNILGCKNKSFYKAKNLNFSRKAFLRQKKQEVQKVIKWSFFQRGYNMVLVQNWPFFEFFFFLLIQASKICFIIFQNEKTPFLAKKTRSLESQKMEFFPKRLQHGFGPNLAIFRIYFFCQYSPTKCVLSYSRTKKLPPWLKNKKFRKSNN